MRLLDWMIKNRILLNEISKKTCIPRFIMWEIITGNKRATPTEALLIEEFTGSDRDWETIS